MTNDRKREIRELKKSQFIQDGSLVNNVLVKRQAAWADRLRSATNATQLYQQYKDSPEQFWMTFAEYKKTRRSS